MFLPFRLSTLLQQTIHSFLFKRLPGVLLGLALGFGLAMIAHGQEPEACGFGLLACDEHGVVWDVTVSGEHNVAQLSGKDGLAEAIIAVGYFLNRIILPLLISVALLVFLYYLARTFIIDAAFTDKREESRKRALWGFAAFILIVSIWGIVNLLVGGLRLDQDRSLCPDYLDSWCGNLGKYGEGGGLGFGSGGGSGGYTPGSDGGGYGAVGDGSGDGTLPQPGSQSALGELLFGNYADQAAFNFREGAPRAAGSAVDLPTTMSCAAGLTALQTSAGIEQLQSGYLLYRDGNNQVRWQNITDATSETAIDYDADTLRPLIQTSNETAVALVHTHPQATIERLSLDMFGYGPSVSDLDLMCDDVVNSAQFVLVDSTNVWVMQSTGATCPRRATEVDALAAISVLTQLAVMERTEREDTLTEMFEWHDLPPSVRQSMRDYESYDFNTMTSADILLLADGLARDGGFSITRQTTQDFCQSF